LPPVLLYNYFCQLHSKSLNKLNVFGTDDFRYLMDVAFHLRPYSVPRGVTFLEHHDVVEEVSFLLRGTVKLYRSDRYSTGHAKKKKEDMTMLGQLSENNYLGDIEMQYKTLSFAEYVAAEECDFAAITVSTLTQILRSHPKHEQRFLSLTKQRREQLVQVFQSVVAPSELGGYVHNLLWIDGVARPKEEVWKMVSGSLTRHHVLTRRTGKGGKVEEVLECEEQLWRRGYIHPQNLVLPNWNAYIWLILLLQIAFYSTIFTFRVDSPVAEATVEALTDISLALDIFIRLRTGFLDSHGVLVTVQSEIFWLYSRMWLFPDILACVPFRFMFNAGPSSLLPEALKLIKLSRLSNMSELRGMEKLARLVEATFRVPPGLLELIKLIVSFITFAHIICCFWWLQSATRKRECWLNSPVTNLDLRFSPWIDQYVTSMYWVITTLSTVGYGDIVPVNTAERVLACFVMVMGGITFSIVVGRVSALLAIMDESKKKVIERTDEVRRGRQGTHARIDLSLSLPCLQQTLSS